MAGSVVCVRRRVSTPSRSRVLNPSGKTSAASTSASLFTLLPLAIPARELRRREGVQQVHAPNLACLEGARCLQRLSLSDSTPARTREVGFGIAHKRLEHAQVDVGVLHPDVRVPAAVEEQRLGRSEPVVGDQAGGFVGRALRSGGVRVAPDLVSHARSDRKLPQVWRPHRPVCQSEAAAFARSSVQSDLAE